MQLLKHFKELTLHPKNAQELKDLILKLAIQGKLTKQWREGNPDVEPASVLLRKLETEKQRLVEEKIIKKEKATLEIKPTNYPYQIPNSWSWQWLTSLFYLIGNRANQLKSSDYIPEGKYPIIDQGKKDIVGYSNDEKKLLKIGHPVIVFGDHTRQVKYIDFDFIIGADGTQILKPFEQIDPKFFFVQLCSFDIEARGYSRHFKILKEKMFVLPPLEEQKAIVATVNQLFAEVEQLEALTKERIQLKADFVTSALQQLTQATKQETARQWDFLKGNFGTFFTEKTSVKKLRESILQLAVQGKLTRAFRESHPELCEGTHSAEALLEHIKSEKSKLIKEGKIKKEKPLPEITEDEIPYELPEGWVWCRLEDLTSITGGVTKGKRNQSDLVNIPYLRVANVQRGFLNLDIIKEILVSKIDFEKYQLKENDLLMIEGGDPDKVGRCAIWSLEIPWCIYQNHIFRVRPFLNSTMDNHFFMQFINSRVTRDYYESCAKRTTNLASINKTQMRNTPIAFPPIEEQKGIVEKINTLMALCDRLEKEIETQKTTQEEWMQSCLREVFEGKENEVIIKC